MAKPLTLYGSKNDAGLFVKEDVPESPGKCTDRQSAQLASRALNNCSGFLYMGGVVETGKNSDCSDPPTRLVRLNSKCG